MKNLMAPKKACDHHGLNPYKYLASKLPRKEYLLNGL
jgi:hypothetical protein